MVYKTDSEKLKELSLDEKNNLLQLIQKQRMEYSGHLEIDIQKIIKEKDDKIHELTVKLRQMKQNDSKKNLQAEPESSPNKVSDLEFSKDQLAKEHELLRKRYEQLINREKSTKDEIRDLKAQLMKKPSTMRTDKSTRIIKEQLQKKIAMLENEAEQLKKTVAEQVSIIETHRVQAADNFDKWKKMKHWQQVAEKLKNKLKEKDVELEKLQQISAGYRVLIERLEREKHNLEQRNRSLKGNNVTLESARDAELLRVENMRLQAELEGLRSRLEMQQNHSGALGAAMMQEKLEAQERKIAILELASKGPSEIRAELERLQISNSNIQKTNLRLEAENLDLQLDLEKASKEVPYLRQQIEHLQSYVNALQSENSEKHAQPTTQVIPTRDEIKKNSELERTVFMLKKVVEKLQAENKRLMNGKRPLSDRVASAGKLKRENDKLKDQCGQYAEKICRLEQDLLHVKSSKSVSFCTKSESDKVAALYDELSKVKEQLQSKTTLLDKVKVLLHRAATKEKMLLEEISLLKGQMQTEGGTVAEVSEGSNTDS
ncbi:unnamed protein product [Acanthoscelides obtectus]|uniref:Uncharacterized protein n=1 Tax=Acanthoscelides obtectus TaxID=200917 RepID=A0A9P0M9D1_ACAOB|nr:unnamed protein product [Acanthoscelides obtectus]